MQQVITTPIQLGHICATARKSLSRSQAVEAAKLGISQSRLSKMELHPETMTLAQVLMLCSSLGLEVQVATRVGPSTAAGQPVGADASTDTPW